jgi:hypothetical protein
VDHISVGVGGGGEFGDDRHHGFSIDGRTEVYAGGVVNLAR